MRVHPVARVSALGTAVTLEHITIVAIEHRLAALLTRRVRPGPRDLALLLGHGVLLVLAPLLGLFTGKGRGDGTGALAAGALGLAASGSGAPLFRGRCRPAALFSSGIGGTIGVDDVLLRRYVAGIGLLGG